MLQMKNVWTGNSLMEAFIGKRLMKTSVLKVSIGLIMTHYVCIIKINRIAGNIGVPEYKDL